MRSFCLITLNDAAACILTKHLILFRFACTITPEIYCLIETSVVNISTAFVTGFWLGFSQFKIETLGYAAKRTVAKSLKYIDISFVRSWCVFIGNSTVSFISRVESKSPASTKKASDNFTPFPCSTRAIGGLFYSLLFDGECTNFGGVEVWRNFMILDYSPQSEEPPSSPPLPSPVLGIRELLLRGVTNPLLETPLALVVEGMVGSIILIFLVYSDLCEFPYVGTYKVFY